MAASCSRGPYGWPRLDAVTDPTDLMRRLVKEDLYTFAGTKRFPERRSYTAEYELSEPEKVLYEKETAR